MPNFRYAKLVRDNIRSLHEANGDTVNGHILPKNQHIQALVEKLKEEADELSAAISSRVAQDVESELADIRQVLEDLTTLLEVDETHIRTAQNQKLQKKGGFKHGQYIDAVHIIDEHDPLVERFRADPTKYPEL